jgi:hypothetical protein
MPIIAHRKESPSQTRHDAILQVASGEIWGKAARLGGLFPTVKAYPGVLPAGARGINFTTGIDPYPNGTPFEIHWVYPHTPGVVKKTKDGTDFAVISAVVTNLQP